MKKGAFTKQALRHHKTPMEFAKEVLEHPEKFTKKTEKRAQFVKNITGKGKEVCMPEKDYMEEHKRLISILEDMAAKTKKEADLQTKEIKAVKGKGKPCVNDVEGGCGMCGGTKGSKSSIRMEIQEIDTKIDELKKRIKQDEASPKTRPTNRKKAKALFSDMKGGMKGGKDMRGIQPVIDYLTQLSSGQSHLIPNPDDPEEELDVILVMQEQGIIPRKYDQEFAEIYQEADYDTVGDLLQILRERF
jgi:hypothetical protein